MGLQWVDTGAMEGFTPSYNLQAPMAVVAVEALRQRRS